MKQAEKVGSNNSLYSDKKSEHFLNEKIVKKHNKTKQKHAFKGFVSSYNVEISNSFNHESCSK